MSEGPKIDTEKMRQLAEPNAGKLNNLLEIQAGIKSRKVPAMGKGPDKDNNDVFHPAMYERERTMTYPDGTEKTFKHIREDR